MDFPFRVIASEDVVPGTVLFVPEVTRMVYENIITGEKKEVMEFNPKAAGLIMNIGGNNDRSKDE